MSISTGSVPPWRKNHQFAVEAYRKLSDGDAAVIDTSWDPRYYQHNPLAANGTEPLKQFMQQQGVTLPSGTTGGTQFGHTLADGDRVVDGKIIEHWAVIADGQQPGGKACRTGTAQAP